MKEKKNRNSIKRLLMLALALVMVLSIVPFSALADDEYVGMGHQYELSPNVGMDKDDPYYLYLSKPGESEPEYKAFDDNWVFDNFNTPAFVDRVYYHMFCIDDSTGIEFGKDGETYLSVPQVIDDLFDAAENRTGNTGLKAKVYWIIANAESVAREIDAANSATYDPYKDIYGGGNVDNPNFDNEDAVNYRVYYTAIQAVLWHYMNGFDLVPVDKIEDGTYPLKSAIRDTVFAGTETEKTAEIAILRRIEKLYNTVIERAETQATPISAKISAEIDDSSATEFEQNGATYYGPLSVTATKNIASTTMKSIQISVEGTFDADAPPVVVDSGFSPCAMETAYGTATSGWFGSGVGWQPVSINAAVVNNGEQFYIKIPAGASDLSITATVQGIANTTDYRDPLIFAGMSEGEQAHDAVQMMIGIFPGGVAVPIYASDSCALDNEPGTNPEPEPNPNPDPVLPKTYSISVSKIDSEIGTSLSGASFTLSKDGYSTSATTGSSGTASFLLPSSPAGTYTLTETSAPDGYNELSGSITLVISAEGAIDSVSGAGATATAGSTTVTVKNVKVGKVVISKTDATDSAPVPGAEIEIWNKTTGEVIFKGLTDENGQISFEKPEPGTYVFKETIAPYGYVLNVEEFEFTVNEDGTITGTLGITNEKDIPAIPPGHTIVPGDDEDTFVELDEDGTPLGTWEKDPETDEWVYFPEEVPLAPKTGDSGWTMYLTIMLAALAALSAIAYIPKKARKTH